VGENNLKLDRNQMFAKQAQLFLDILVLAAAFVLAYLLRFEFRPSQALVQSGLEQMPYVVLLQFSALFIAGVYSFIWRYVGMAEIGAFLRAGAGAFLVLVALRLGMPEFLGNLRVPLSVIFIDTVLGFGGVLSLRVLRRALYERNERDHKTGNGRQARKAVLLVGAGQAGMLAAKEIVSRGETCLSVKGFVDDDPRKQGARVLGVKVVGTSRDIPRLVKRLGIDHVIITIASASRKEIKRIVEICESVPVKARIIPGLFEVLDGQVSLSRVRDVEIEDLLGRDQVNFKETELLDFISGKVVMVTGAGGSIGSELARQAARLASSRLLLVERAECALFNIHRELVAAYPGLDLIPLIADVGDEIRMRSIFKTYQPAIVVHAAAHKHVPMMEWNCGEAVKNNVLGTEAVGRLAGECGAEAFVFISTDKAVKPASIMGASKRMAELVCQALDKQYATKYVSVRFGNVLGSTGSVVPIFREQIAKGGPVTVTHPEMVRFFMTIPEAAQLVLRAGAMGKGGEIFILDMGEPVKILDLARQMITLSGLKPGEDIEIAFTGVRPGEKMFEELVNRCEISEATKHPKIFIARSDNVDISGIGEALKDLAMAAKQDDQLKVRDVLWKHIPEATPAVKKALRVVNAAPVC
jgi:FlaA1/EpsC-like NDP-sugar epimerase